MTRGALTSRQKIRATVFGMKKIFLPLLVFFLFSGASLAVAPHAVASEKKASQEKGEEKEPETITGGRFSGDPIYVHIKPMVLPVINEDGIQQLVSLILAIHVKDQKTAERLQRNMPRVIDALYRNLYGALGEGTLTDGKMANIRKIKSKSVQAMSELVDKENIVDVLVQAISQRML